MLIEEWKIIGWSLVIAVVAIAVLYWVGAFQ